MSATRAGAFGWISTGSRFSALPGPGIRLDEAKLEPLTMDTFSAEP